MQLQHLYKHILLSHGMHALHLIPILLQRAFNTPVIHHLWLRWSFRRTREILIRSQRSGKRLYMICGEGWHIALSWLNAHNVPIIFSVGSLIGQVCRPTIVDASVFYTKKAAHAKPCTSYRLGSLGSIITEPQLGLVFCQRRLNVMAHPTTARGRANTTFNISIHKTRVFHSFLFHPTY